MILKLDFQSEEPIYTQIINEIIKGVAKGELENDDELPSVRGLADDIGVNMHTVNKCYGILRDMGYIRIDRRRGAVIDISLEDTNKKYVESLKKDMELQVAEVINRGIPKEDVLKLFDEIFENYNSERLGNIK